MQDRDGFKAQLESLRDKVSTLSRELAEGTDSHDKQSAEVASLRDQIARMQEEHAARLAELQSSVDRTNKSLQERSDELEAAQIDFKKQVCIYSS